jgi:uncharacterized membrane protein YphA (DoxX/SURF4 family)
MSSKTTRIIGLVLMILPSLMLVMSGVMKLSGAPQIVEGLTKVGLSPYIKLFGVIELISVALFLYPKTFKIGFLLICCYLGGALSIELSTAQPPTAAIFLTISWIGVYLRDRSVFVSQAK